MTKLGRMAVVAVLTAFASTAMAEDGGWNTKYGLLFNLQNVFQNNSPGVIDSYNGYGTGLGVGAQMNMAPTRALRVYANLSRYSDPEYEQTTNGVVTKVLPSPTSVYDAEFGAAYMLRLSTAGISPYVGAGAALGFTQISRNGEFGTGTAITQVDNKDRSFGLGVQGLLGLEWRVHKALALFAEYSLDVALYSQRKVENESRAGTTVTSSSFSQTRFLNFDTGVGQAGQLGVVAFF